MIDVSNPEAAVLRYELLLADADLNRIRIYRDRYLVVAAGTAANAAALQIYDLEAEPALLTSFDLPSRQATMVTIYQDYALITTGDDGGVITAYAHLGEVLVDQQDISSCQVSVHKVLLLQVLHAHGHLVHQVDNVLHCHSVPVRRRSIRIHHVQSKTHRSIPI